MTSLLALVKPTRWSVVLVGLPFGAMMMWFGWRTWQGRFPGRYGPQPPYQSYFGVGLVGLPGGGGFAMIALGELLRGVMGLDVDGGFYLATSIVAVVLLAVGFVYQLCYFWFGVPPWLRSPYQRTQSKPDHGRRTLTDRMRPHHR